MKQTQLQVLQAILKELKAIRVTLKQEETVEVSENLVKNGLVTIKDIGKKTSEILAEYKSKFDVWTWKAPEELDREFPPVVSQRKFKYEQECEDRGKSADEYDAQGVRGITLREWMIFDMIYFEKEGKHLDENYVTLCTGKRYASGAVPDACWRRDYRRASMGRYDPGARNAACGVRSAVSV